MHLYSILTGYCYMELIIDTFFWNDLTKIICKLYFILRIIKNYKIFKQCKQKMFQNNFKSQVSKQKNCIKYFVNLYVLRLMP